MITTVFLTLFSIAIGATVTFLVARWYYERATGELQREASELKDYTVMLLDYLDDARMIDVERDAHGDPVRVRVIKREASDSVSISDNVEPELMPETYQ